MACNVTHVNRFMHEDHEVFVQEILADEAITKVHIYFENTIDVLNANVWLHTDEASGDVLVTLHHGKSIFAFNDPNTAFEFKMRFA
ncbi:MAG: hypothetical protein EOP83_11510 [Verrucomicrobiaceae bacterium]|nr:MAG: hypothetical protein EOP83_11510 [Verrucomicrobiaceae bacterium]